MKDTVRKLFEVELRRVTQWSRPRNTPQHDIRSQEDDAIPSTLAPPPESWENQFRTLANEYGLTSGMEEGFREVERFLTQVPAPGKTK